MHPMLIKRILRESQIFCFFDDRDIAHLADHMFSNLRKFEKGDVLIRATDSVAENSRMYIVLEGALKVTLPRSGGEHDVVLNVLTDGAIFGELAMLDGAPRSASVTALTDGVAVSIQRSDFFHLAKKQPDMLEKVIWFLCAEIRRLSVRFEQVATLSVQQRLAAYLLALSKTFKGQPIRMTQQELGGAVGATREQTSRIMNQFYKDGYVEKIDAEPSARNAEQSARSGGKHAQITVTANGEKALELIAQSS